MTKFARVLLAIAVLALCTTGLAYADNNNLVTNGGFETGDFTGWSVTGDTTFAGVCDVTTCPGGFAPYEGNYAGYFGAVGDTVSISQLIPTTPGDTYSLSFYLANPVGGTPNYFGVTFGSSTFSFSNFGVAFSWQEFTLTTVATSNETPLQFTFRNDPGYWFLDNVNVQQSGGTIPEPSTLALFGSGVLGLAGIVRRKFRT